MCHAQVLKKIYPKIHTGLCPYNKLDALALLVKNWLSLERAPPMNGRVGGTDGRAQVSYPVVGWVLVGDWETLVGTDIDARGYNSVGSSSTPPAVQPPLVAPPHAASASGGGVSAIAAIAAAYGFEEGSAEAAWLSHVLATARADAAESAAMDRDQTKMHFCREAWLSVLNYHYEDDISYDEYVQCCNERGPDATDAMFAERAQSRRPESDAFHTQELARVEAYKRGEGPDAEAATAHARKVAAFESDSASRAQLPPEEQARAAFLLDASAPCPPVVHVRSAWERGCPLPPRPFLGFDLECKPLGPADPDYTFVRAQLLQSVDDAFDVRVWSVRREVQEAMYKLELKRIGNEQLLWHSTRDTDPTTLVFADHPFDKTRSGLGSYGSGLYFSKHAIYGGRILPCRVAKLDEADGVSGALPAKGDDVMLLRELPRGGSDLAVYTVLDIGADGNSMLYRLPWNASRKERPNAIEHCRLGNGVGDTTLWRYADRRYSILAAVALGRVKDYGKAFRESLERAPDGYHSVSGTEGDLNIQQVTDRCKWYPEWERDFAPLQERGCEFGQQYVVFHESQAVPRFIIRYRRKRAVSPSWQPPPAPEPPAARRPPPSSRKRRALSPDGKWVCINCQFENDGGDEWCKGVEKRGGRDQKCGRKRE